MINHGAVRYNYSINRNIYCWYDKFGDNFLAYSQYNSRLKEFNEDYIKYTFKEKVIEQISIIIIRLFDIKMLKNEKAIMSNKTWYPYLYPEKIKRLRLLEKRTSKFNRAYPNEI